MRFGSSLFLIAVGVILYFAVTATLVGIDIQIVGLILMIFGVIGFILALVFRDRESGTRRVLLMDWALALIALALLGVAAISRRLAGTPLTPTMLFVAFGLLFGPRGARRHRPLELQLDGAGARGGDARARALLRRVTDRLRAAAPRASACRCGC